ncbi:MAG: type II toxin-antitoxin system VapC family toxin [Cyanobacteria bacterium P01_A01_bin.83]
MSRLQKLNSQKLNIAQPLNKLIEQQCLFDGITIIDIKTIHAIEAGNLPLHHKDPFDRMIIAQANIENLTIVTSDSVFKKYDSAILNQGDHNR